MNQAPSISSFLNNESLKSEVNKDHPKEASLVLASNNHPDYNDSSDSEQLYSTLKFKERKNTWPMKQFPTGDYQLPSGTMEKFALAVRKEVCISTIFAIIHCSERFTYFTDLYSSPEENRAFNKLYPDAESTIDVNKLIAIAMPMLLRRTYEINQKAPSKKIKLKIHGIGDYIALATPWELTVSDSGTFADMGYYIDHRAKICENGQIVFTHLTCPDGTVVSGIAEHTFSNSDGATSQPFLEGIPFDPLGNEWTYLKAPKLH